jgi:hypothetical protein
MKPSQCTPPPLEVSKETKNTLNRDLKHPSLVDLIGTKQNKTNKWLYHERLYPENKVLHLMFYYELKLHRMKVC